MKSLLASFQFLSGLGISPLLSCVKNVVNWQWTNLIPLLQVKTANAAHMRIFASVTRPFPQFWAGPENEASLNPPESVEIPNCLTKDFYPKGSYRNITTNHLKWLCVRQFSNCATPPPPPPAIYSKILAISSNCQMP